MAKTTKPTPHQQLRKALETHAGLRARVHSVAGRVASERQEVEQAIQTAIREEQDHGGAAPASPDPTAGD